MSKLIGNQEFNGDVYVKGVGGYDGTSATVNTAETIQTVLNTYIDAISAHTENETIHITAEERETWNSKASSVQADWNTTATTDASYIKNKPTIPTVPTSNTAFTNDAGYITGYTETDPTVSAWAKASSKPTYTADEVGALPTGTTLDNIADGTTRKLSNYATTDTVNTLNNTVTAHTADTTIHVTNAEKSTWNGKQDVISDLAEIRSNAASGMSAYSNVNALSAATIALSAATVTLSSSTNTDIQAISANTIELSAATVELSVASEDFFDGAEYISSAKTIVFKNGNVEKASIDATEFIKDGMVSAVTISGGSMIISFNTDAGREDIALELTDIFNPDNYYTKDNINNGVSASTLELSAGTISELAKKSNTGHTHAISEVNGLQSALDGKSDTGHTHDNYATTDTVNTLNNTVTAHTADTTIHVTATEKSTWDGKQDAISDIAEIRTNAASGMSAYNNVNALSAATTAHTGNNNIHVTAAQKTEWTNGANSGLSAYENVQALSAATTAHTGNSDIHVTGADKSAWNGKQDAIGDLAEIRANAASGMAAYNNVNALSAGTIDELSKKSNTGHTHTISEVNGLQTALDGKSGTGHTHDNYATTEVVNALNNTVTAHTANTEIHVTTAQTAAWNNKQDAIADLETIRSNAEAGAAKVSNVQADWNTTATTDESYIKNKPTIPTVPTSNTAFTNDAGYITGYTETDPTVPEWAKAENKPAYTASEVGALPTGTTLDNVADGTNRKLSNYATTGTVNTLDNTVTAHTADTTIHVTTAQTSVWDGKQDAINDLETIRSNAEAGAAKVSNVQSDWNATTGLAAILNKPTIPSAPGTLTTTATTAQSTATNEALTGNISLHKVSKTGSYNDLTDKPTIPVVPTSNTAFTNDAGYITGYTETDPTVPAWAKAASKPTYTANEVGALPTGTTLDNIADGTTRKLSDYATTANLNDLSGGTTAHTSNSAIHVPTGGTNGQVLMIQNGVPQWVTPSTITYSSSAPTGGNDGDIWVQTS